MQIGFVGLGKMGGNMVARIRRDSDHEVVAFDFNADAVKAAEEHGAAGAESLEDLVGKLSHAARGVGHGPVRRGRPRRRSTSCSASCPKGDLIVDGGNSKWTDSIAHHAKCAERGVHFVDVGTSGGVWGLEIGYCMMVGRRGRGGRAARRRSSTCSPRRATEDEPTIGWGHMGGPGAGHFVKMVHNGIEYGLMQAYAEGFELLHKSDYGLDIEQIAKLWSQGSVIRSWLLELAARAFEADGNDLARARGLGRGLRRGPLDAGRRDRPRRADADAGAALFARFCSRGAGDYARGSLAALRNQFGGHAVKTAPKV